MSEFNYWEECILEACEDCGLSTTKEQIECIASWVEGAHDNFGMAHGYDSIPNPLNSEVERLEKRIEKIEKEHDKCIYGIKKGVAFRRGVSVGDVIIDGDGHVTYHI